MLNEGVHVLNERMCYVTSLPASLAVFLPCSLPNWFAYLSYLKLCPCQLQKRLETRGFP